MYDTNAMQLVLVNIEAKSLQVRGEIKRKKRSSQYALYQECTLCAFDSTA